MISILLLVVAGYYWYTFRQIDNGVTRIPGIQVNRPASASKGDIDGKDQNILLVGNDDRTTMSAAESKELHAAPDGGSLNTDTMMIVHVPADGSKATLISLPRDTYVNIAGYGMNRLNSAYAFAYNAEPRTASLDAKRAAGANLLLSTITKLTGLTINHYIQVDLLGFYRISNAIGGVPVTLCHAVDDTHAANHAAGLTGGSGLKLTKGKHVLKGVQALEFVRQRHFLPRGDLDRVRRQQYFLTAAFRQVASVGILIKLKALGSAVQKSVYLDPGLNLIQLAQQLENLSANNITSKTIPTSNAVINGADVLQVKPSKVRAFVERVIGQTSPGRTSSRSTPTSRTRSPGATGTTRTPATKPIDSKCIN